ncbi:MAG: hypothetical protein K2H90_00840, partial [Oscillospiraceae bacterium]|nr:hypothetical protein [Oscillospiraceae bacterium]
TFLSIFGKEAFMDNNEFSFDELLNCDDFSRYESIATHYARSDFLKMITEYVKDEKAVEKIKRESEELVYCAFNDAFKQGFKFAVKSIIFILKQGV